MSWRKVKLGEFLKVRENRYKPNDKSIAKLKRIDKIDFSGNIFLSDKSSKTDMILVKKGDLVISGINVEKGAMSVYQGEEDVTATIHYSSYEFDTNKIDIDFLKFYLKSDEFREAIKEQVPGGIKTEIKPKHLLPLVIEIPTKLNEQKQIVKQLQNSFEKIDTLNNEQSHQLSLLKNLRQQILKDAMQGKLVAPSPKERAGGEVVESGKTLLEKIKIEKTKLNKKEKPLAEIKEDEIPFDIPKNWVWCRLGEICEKIGSGSTPKGSNYSKTGFPFFRSQNVHDDGLFYDDIKFISDEVQKQMNGTVVFANDILLNITGGSMGRCALLPTDFKEGNVSQHVCIIRPILIDNSFLHKYILSPTFQEFIFSSTTGAGREGLPKYNLEQFVVPLPPLSEQQRIVSKIEELMTWCDALEASVKQNQAYTNLLYQTALKEALQPKAVEEEIVAEPKATRKQAKVIALKPTNVDYYRRSVLAAEIVWQLHKEPTLGHLKLQKLIYLCQKSTDMQLPTNFLRQAMGPYDNQMMRSIDKQLKEHKWFEYHKEELLKYQPLEKAGQHHNDYLKYFLAENESIQFLLDKFKSVKSDTVEIVATLYACIDTMLTENVIFSEALLLKRFYEWSEHKKDFTEEEVKKVFSRMKDTGIIPKGFIVNP